MSSLLPAQMAVPRHVGKGKEQGEKLMAHGFQGQQLLAEVSGLSQTNQVETAKAGQCLCSNKTSQAAP